MILYSNEEHRPVVEPADTADLKPAAETHEGSSPSEPTKNVELIAKIDWSGRHHVILDKLLELPGAKEIVNEILATAPSIQSMFSKDLDKPKTPKQRWEDMMVASELPIKVGQKRMFFVDGVGDLDGTITMFDDEACWLLVDGDEAPWWIPWDAPGMSHVGMLIGGEVHQKLLADAEREATGGKSV